MKILLNTKGLPENERSIIQARISLLINYLILALVLLSYSKGSYGVGTGIALVYWIFNAHLAYFYQKLTTKYDVMTDDLLELVESTQRQAKVAQDHNKQLLAMVEGKVAQGS